MMDKRVEQVRSFLWDNRIPVVVGLFVFALIIILFSRGGDTMNSQDVHFAKSVSYDPCPEQGECSTSWVLYGDGRLVLEQLGRHEFDIEKRGVRKVKKQIKKNDVRDKDCTSYWQQSPWTVYTIGYNDEKKQVQWPGCEEEIKEIEDLIPKNYLSYP